MKYMHMRKNSIPKLYTMTHSRQSSTRPGLAFFSFTLRYERKTLILYLWACLELAYSGQDIWVSFI